MLAVLDQGIGDSFQSPVLRCCRQCCQPQGGILGAFCTLLHVHGSQCPSLAIAIGIRGRYLRRCLRRCFLTLADNIQGLLESFEPLFLCWSLSREQPDSEWKAHKALRGGLAALVKGGNVILQAWPCGHPIRYHRPIAI